MVRAFFIFRSICYVISCIVRDLTLRRAHGAGQRPCPCERRVDEEAQDGDRAGGRLFAETS